MLRANQAVRLGLRAASRNPELAFGKALLDLSGSLLSLLPVLFAFALVARSVGAREPLQLFLQVAARVRALSWPLLGAGLVASLLTWTLSIAFWAGALPLLAADAELGERPPVGTFFALMGRGFPRVLGAGALASGLSAIFGLGLSAAGIALLPALARRPGPGVVAALALLLAFGVVAGLLVDVLGRLILVRAAALGDSVTVAFGRASGLLGARLGTCLTVALAFVLLEMIAAGAAATLGGALASSSFAPAALFLSLGPRLALGIATAAVFAWLETARQAALAALAADEDGLIPIAPEPVPAYRSRESRRPVAAWELRPLPGADAHNANQRSTPRAEPVLFGEPVIEALLAEPVIEALPAEPIIEALPAEPIIEALPADPIIEARPEPIIEALPAESDEAPPKDDQGSGTGP